MRWIWHFLAVRPIWHFVEISYLIDDGEEIEVVFLVPLAEIEVVLMDAEVVTRRDLVPLAVTR